MTDAREVEWRELVKELETPIMRTNSIASGLK